MTNLFLVVKLKSGYIQEQIQSYSELKVTKMVKYAYLKMMQG